MEQLLTASAKALAELYPAFATEIQAGLMLALAGRIAKLDDNRWQVGGGTITNGQANVYLVNATPTHWYCNCEGSKFRPAGELLQQRGQICKHICGVALSRPANQYPGKPATAWEMFERLIRAQQIPPVDTPISLPGTRLSLCQHKPAEASLRFGRIRSATLVEWQPFPNFPKAGGMWQLTSQAKAAYEEFVTAIKEKNDNHS